MLFFILQLKRAWHEGHLDTEIWKLKIRVKWKLHPNVRGTFLILLGRTCFITWKDQSLYQNDLKKQSQKTANLSKYDTELISIRNMQFGVSKSTSLTCVSMQDTKYRFS